MDQLMTSPTARPHRRGGRRRRALALAGAIALAAVPAAVARAASLSGAVSTTVTTPVNLTTEGTTDWAVWSYSTNPISTPASQTAAPSNRKAAVVPSISSAVTLVGNARGTASTPPTLTYTYSDGTSPTTLTPAAGQGVLFDTTLNNTNSGFTFNITAGAAGVPQVAKLYLSGFDTKPTLTVTLPGATSYLDNSFTYSATARAVTLYTLNFTPDNTGDVLTVRYQSTTVNGTNANADLQAVTLATVPEPSAAAGLLCPVVGGLLARRRRRR